jgi:hypothetical protein
MEDNSFTKKTVIIKKSSKRSCVYCGKPIKAFSKWDDTDNRKVHRKCWLKNRSWEWRHLDWLFTEKEFKITKGCRSIRPTVSPPPPHSPLPPPQKD